MLKTKKKIISCFVVLCMMITLFAACKPSDSSSTGTGKTTSKTASTKASSSASAKASVSAGSSSTASADDTATNTGGTNTDASGGPTSSNPGQPGPGTTDPDYTPPPPGYHEEGEPIDFAGQTITIINWNSMSWESAAEGTSNYVQWNRMKEAEAKYNLTFDCIKIAAATMNEEFMNNHMAGTKYCDIIYSQSKFSFPKFVTQGALLNIGDYYDWRSNSAIQNNVFLNGCFWSGQPYAMPDGQAAYGIGVVFNRTMLQENGCEEPLDLVDRGDWTWDTFVTICQKTTKDFDNDGIVDQYGTCGSVNEGVIFSNGANYVRVENNRVIFDLNSTAARRAIGFFSELYNTTRLASPDEKVYKIDKGNCATYFSANSNMTSVRNSLGTDINSGVIDFVPLPKGPNVSSCQNISTAANQWCFSVRATQPAELMTVWADIICLWDDSRGFGCMSFMDSVKSMWGPRLGEGRSLEVLARHVPDAKYDFIDGLSSAKTMITNNILTPVKNNETNLATALDQWTSAIQSEIDSFMN